MVVDMLFKKFRKNEHAIELPINIVVMLVVGMVSLAALLAMIPPSKKNLTVDIIEIKVGNKTSDGNSAKVLGAGEHIVKVNVKVYDRDNNPVEKASVSLSGGGGYAAGKTDESGEATIELGGNGGTKVIVRPNQQTVELKLVAKANGFYDYEDGKAVLLYQTRK